MANEHQAGLKSQIKLMAGILAIATLMGFALLIAAHTWLALIAAAAGWIVLGIYVLLALGFIEPVGNAIGRVLLPSGRSTPPAKGLSHIEAMAARGDYAMAAEAYRHEILTDPTDVLSCERLGWLARTELKDADLALFAFREGEARAPTRQRGFAFGLMTVDVLRDLAQDPRRAVVEIRRILTKYPEAPNATQLRDEMNALKRGFQD